MASRINLNIVAAWRRLSLRGRLLLLVATAILPLLAFSLIAQYLAYRDAVARINDRTLVLAHSAAFGVEQELQKYIAVLEVLAVAPSLLAGDLVTFRRRVEDFLGPRLPNANLLLLSADGQQLMNTGLPPGAPLPVRQSLGSMRQAMETGGPTVSDLYHGVVVDRPVIGINVPVKREDGSVAQILSLNPASEAFDEIIRRQQMPAGWFVAVFDRQGVIVTRVPNREQFVGRQAAPQFLQHLMGQRDGVVENTTREGVPVLTAFVHSEHFGWAVAISVPRTELTKPAYDAFIGTLAGGGILLLVSVGLALALARGISGPIGVLRQLAAGGGADLSAAPVRTGLHEADEVVGALRAAEERRRRSEQSFRYLFESSPLPIWVFDPESLAFLAVNDVAVATYGYTRTEFLALKLTEILPAEDVARAEQAIGRAPQRQHSVDFRHRYKDGRLIDIEAFSHAIMFEERPARVVVVLDVTARKAAEAQLVQAQKMEAVGQLTGGMAHDFNNLLGVIIGNLGLLRESGRDDPDFEEFVDEAQRAARRGADLTRSLLAFARRQPLRPVNVDLNDLIGNTATLLRRTLGEQIEISLGLGSGIWPIVVDPSQLEAALINLATNARDAMRKGGRLSIATENKHLDADYAATHAEVKPGDYAMLQVSDSGIGIAPETLTKIFEPFFTTKAVGEGTGLGLSMVFGFIKQSGGHISVYSELGVGTTFRLYLPRDRAPHEVVEGDAAEPLPRGNGERILVVEDEPAMRRVVARQLEQLGYHVEQAENAQAALQILEARGPIDLMFTDIVMAGRVDGFDLSRIVSERWPATRIVLTSGFPATNIPGDVVVASTATLLSKPYRKIDLARVIHRALRGGADREPDLLRG